MSQDDRGGRLDAMSNSTVADSSTAPSKILNTSPMRLHASIELDKAPGERRRGDFSDL